MIYKYSFLNSQYFEFIASFVIQTIFILAAD
jgi:hypothetical protein